jgi:hypothetical protein
MEIGAFEWWSALGRWLMSEVGRVPGFLPSFTISPPFTSRMDDKHDDELWQRFLGLKNLKRIETHKKKGGLEIKDE